MGYVSVIDTTINGKKFKKGDILPNELSNFPAAKFVEDSEIKGVPKIKEIPKEIKKIEVKKEEKKDGRGRPKKR